MLTSDGKACLKPDGTAPTPGDTGTCPVHYVKLNGVCVAEQPAPDDSKDKDFCKQNPDLQICKKGSLNGQCGSFTCEGDALQCAIAMDQHKRSCQMFDTPSDESNLYNTDKGKTGSQTGSLPGNESISLSGRIDTSNILGGGGCIRDLSVTLWRTSVSLPFSTICPYLEQLGNILLAVSFLLAIRIITRG